MRLAPFTSVPRRAVATPVTDARNESRPGGANAQDRGRADAILERAVERSIEHAVSAASWVAAPSSRRVGAATAAAALASVFPSARARARAGQAGRREKTSRSASSDHLRDADHHGRAHGFYKNDGLNVQVTKACGGR